MNLTPMEQENLVFSSVPQISYAPHQEGQKHGRNHHSYRDLLQNLDKDSTASFSGGDDPSGARMTPPSAEVTQEHLETNSLEKLRTDSSAKPKMRTPRGSFRKKEAESIPEKTRIRRPCSKVVDYVFDDEEHYNYTRKLDFVQSEQKQEEKFVNMIKLAENEHLGILLNIDENYSWCKLDPTEAQRSSPCMIIL